MWVENEINIDGWYLNRLRFADDIVLIITDLFELQNMFSEHKIASENRSHHKHRKTEVITVKNTVLTNRLYDQLVKTVDEYVYLCYTIKLGIKNQTVEIKGKIRMI